MYHGKLQSLVWDAMLVPIRPAKTSGVYLGYFKAFLLSAELSHIDINASMGGKNHTWRARYPCLRSVLAHCARDPSRLLLALRCSHVIKLPFALIFKHFILYYYKVHRSTVGGALATSAYAADSLNLQSANFG